MFSWRHDRPRFNPPQPLLVPREELAELRADIGSLFVGHPAECTPAYPTDQAVGFINSIPLQIRTSESATEFSNPTSLSVS